VRKDERVEKLKQLAELQARVREQRGKIQLLADNDPEIMAELGAWTPPPPSQVPEVLMLNPLSTCDAQSARSSCLRKAPTDGPVRLFVTATLHLFACI
jgi:hypothetical protein